MKMKHKISLHLGFACIAALCVGLTVLGPGCDLAGGDSGDATNAPTRDSSSTGVSDALDIDTSLPDSSIDSVLIEDDGTYTLLNGEIRLTVTNSALSGERLQVRKFIDTEGGTPVIGYIWGPHGKPIDPPADLEVNVSLNEIRAEKPSELRLFAVPTEGKLTPLTQEAPTIDGDQITFRTKLTEIIDLRVQVQEL